MCIRDSLYPSEVHLGLLSGMEALDVVLWNATFAPVQLVGVNSASSAGTTLSGFRPGVLPPTGALKGLLTVLSSGPAQQDTTYTFVTGIGERSLTITASRVLLFPFWPDWSDGLEIDYAFDTVLTRGENCLLYTSGHPRKWTAISRIAMRRRFRTQLLFRPWWCRSLGTSPGTGSPGATSATPIPSASAIPRRSTGCATLRTARRAFPACPCLLYTSERF